MNNNIVAIGALVIFALRELSHLAAAVLFVVAFARTIWIAAAPYSINPQMNIEDWTHIVSTGVCWYGAWRLK